VSVSFDAHQLDSVLLVGSAVMLVAILAVRVSVRAGLPSLLVYLLMGVLLGEAGLGIEFGDANVAHALGFAALVVILAEGGLTTHWPDIRPAMPLGAALATLGVAVSVAVVAVGSHLLFGISWELAVLLGAVTSPTDSAAVFSVLRRVPLPRRITGALEAESGLNDAPTVLLVTLVSAGTVLDHGVGGFVGVVVYELAAGVLAGLLVGFGGAAMMRRVALPSSGLYPIAVLALTVLAYAGTAALHASGFAAVYTAALVLGNSELPHRAATRSFAEGLAWLAQIGLFVMLGLLVSPSRIDLVSVGYAVVAGLLLTYVARPLSVAACWVFGRMSLRESVFVSWAGLRGPLALLLECSPDGLVGDL
jgi:cell volume regulation protein A